MDGNAVNLAGDVSTLSVEPQTITAPLVLDGGNRLLYSAGGDLTIGGPIGEAGGAFGIIKTGPGKVVLAGNNTYHGAKRIETGTLALSPTGDILTDSPISVAAGATLEIEGGVHSVGTIDGWGTTIVDPDATLTATSIVQDTLIIGSIPKVAAVPEPGTFLLLLTAVSGMFFAGRRRLL